MGTKHMVFQAVAVRRDEHSDPRPEPLPMPFVDIGARMVVTHLAGGMQSGKSSVWIEVRDDSGSAFAMEMSLELWRMVSASLEGIEKHKAELGE